MSVPSVPWGLITQRRSGRSEGKSNSSNSNSWRKWVSLERSHVGQSWRQRDIKGGSRWVDLLSKDKRPVLQRNLYWIYWLSVLETDKEEEVCLSGSDLSPWHFEPWQSAALCFTNKYKERKQQIIFNWSHPWEQLHRRSSHSHTA